MSFYDNDFPKLINKMIEEYEKKPLLLFVATIKELFAMAKRAPIYPGIVFGEARNVLENCSLETLEPNQEVVVHGSDGKYILGTVASVDGDTLKLRNVTIHESVDECSVTHPITISRIKKNLLQKWGFE